MGVMLLSLVQAMKKIIAPLLAVAVLCSVMLHGQSNNSASKQPAEWSLSLKTDGAPWTKKFEVKLNQTGALVVAEENPEKMPGPTMSKVTVNLSAKDVQGTYDQALKAFRDFRFAEEAVERADGTNLTLRLSSNGRVLVMQFFHLGNPEDESPEVAKLLSLINKHLPKEHQIY